jgi:hypothetical protein
MARTLAGAFWQFLRYEISSRARGDLVLQFETAVLQGNAHEVLFWDLMGMFPNAQYRGAGDEAGAWKVTVHVPHGGKSELVRAKLDEWATRHRPPLISHSVGSRGFRRAA